MFNTSYDHWKTASPDDARDDYDDNGECPYCCLDADVGCDDCTRPCSHCNREAA